MWCRIASAMLMHASGNITDTAAQKMVFLAYIPRYRINLVTLNVIQTLIKHTTANGSWHIGAITA